VAPGGTGQLAARVGKEGGVDGLVLIAPGFAPDHFPAKSLKLFQAPLLALELAAPLLRRGFAARALHPETIECKTDTHKRLMARLEAAAGSNPMHVCQAFYQQIQWATPELIDAVEEETEVVLIVGEADKLTPVAWSEALQQRLCAPRTHAAREVDLHVIPTAVPPPAPQRDPGARATATRAARDVSPPPARARSRTR